jgi:hypothetical protein
LEEVYLLEEFGKHHTPLKQYQKAVALLEAALLKGECYAQYALDKARELIAIEEEKIELLKLQEELLPSSVEQPDYQLPSEIQPSFEAGILPEHKSGIPSWPMYSSILHKLDAFVTFLNPIKQCQQFVTILEKALPNSDHRVQNNPCKADALIAVEEDR